MTGGGSAYPTQAAPLVLVCGKGNSPEPLLISGTPAAPSLLLSVTELASASLPIRGAVVGVWRLTSGFAFFRSAISFLPFQRGLTWLSSCLDSMGSLGDNQCRTAPPAGSQSDPALSKNLDLWPATHLHVAACWMTYTYTAKACSLQTDKAEFWFPGAKKRRTGTV